MTPWNHRRHQMVTQIKQIDPGAFKTYWRGIVATEVAA